MEFFHSGLNRLQAPLHSQKFSMSRINKDDIDGSSFDEKPKWGRHLERGCEVADDTKMADMDLDEIDIAEQSQDNQQEGDR